MIFKLVSIGVIRRMDMHCISQVSQVSQVSFFFHLHELLFPVLLSCTDHILFDLILMFSLYVCN